MRVRFLIVVTWCVAFSARALAQDAPQPVDSADQAAVGAVEEQETDAPPADAPPPVEAVPAPEVSASPSVDAGEPARQETSSPADGQAPSEDEAPAEAEPEIEEREPGVLRFGSVEIVPDLKLYADYQIDLGSDDYDNAFHITRGYLGLRAQITSWLGGRVTYDVSQAGDLGRSGAAAVEGEEAEVESSRLSGSVVARLKYAYLDLGIPRLSMRLRFGVVQTPYIDWIEHIEGSRFLRKVMFEHEYHYPSADFGLTLVGNVRDYLSYHVGVYNGEGYHGVEDSSFKDIIARLSLRPAPGLRGLSGLQLTGYVQVEIIGGDDDEVETHRRYGGALTYRLAREITSPDCTRAEGDVLAAWVQVFGGQEGPASDLADSFGLSIGARFELPPRMFLITRLDRFDPDLDADDDSIWTVLAAFGVHVWDGVVIALDYQGRIGGSGDDQHLLGLHTELHL
jgi:hypothetical protein